MVGPAVSKSSTVKMGGNDGFGTECHLVLSFALYTASDNCFRATPSAGHRGPRLLFLLFISTGLRFTSGDAEGGTGKAGDAEGGTGDAEGGTRDAEEAA